MRRRWRLVTRLPRVCRHKNPVYQCPTKIFVHCSAAEIESLLGRHFLRKSTRLLLNLERDSQSHLAVALELLYAGESTTIFEGFEQRS
jgi:hypothetical protein